MNVFRWVEKKSGELNYEALKYMDKEEKPILSWVSTYGVRVIKILFLKKRRKKEFHVVTKNF